MTDVWRVLPDGNHPGWKVQRPNGTDVPLFTLQEDAVAFARREAIEVRGTVEIHDANRALRSTISYEDA